VLLKTLRVARHVIGLVVGKIPNISKVLFEDNFKALWVELAYVNV